MNKIILASQSPRRKQLLEWAEIPFDIIVSGADETYPDDLPLEDIAVYIARNKAAEVRQVLASDALKGHLPILAADTIVIANGTVLGKPEDRNDAIRMLQVLSGITHQVITGVVLLTDQHEYSFAEKTDVTFHTLSRQEIEGYVDKYKPYDKAGSYAIQEWIGVVGIQKIQGDFYNVMGLPVSRVARLLHQLSM